VWHCGRGNQLQFALLQLHADTANRAAPKSPEADRKYLQQQQQKLATTIATIALKNEGVGQLCGSFAATLYKQQF